MKKRTGKTVPRSRRLLAWTGLALAAAAAGLGLAASISFWFDWLSHGGQFRGVLAGLDWTLSLYSTVMVLSGLFVAGLMLRIGRFARAALIARFLVGLAIVDGLASFVVGLSGYETADHAGQVTLAALLAAAVLVACLPSILVLRRQRKEPEACQQDGFEAVLARQSEGD